MASLMRRGWSPSVEVSLLANALQIERPWFASEFAPKKAEPDVYP